MPQTTTQQKKNKAGRKVLRFFGVGLGVLLIFTAFLACYAAGWYADTYGQLGFDAVLYTLLSDLGGVESTLIADFLRTAAIPALFWATLVCLVLFTPWKKKLVLLIGSKFRLRLFPVRPVVALVVTLGLFGGLIYRAADTSQLLEYLRYMGQETAIFQNEYRDPDKTEIKFPEKKRNLVYIYLESMETTFFSRAQGGMQDTCVIPELYDLAANNVSFSCTGGVGGLHCGAGAGWTIGAMVTQTAGIPLKTPPGMDGNDYGGDGAFLPGAASLTDVLHDNGYYQALMVGSDADFGGRATYFKSHNVDKIYDLFTAREDGHIPPDYIEWWGFEDIRLYQYAKKELPKLAEQDQPFAFYMLTADTHHVDGYICPYCESTYEKQYENVFSCASRQAMDFVQWLQEQDFYENTTVVIVGDHPSMDNAYIQSVLDDENYVRDVYNCFINSAVRPVRSINRVAYTIDMFPTVLAAMGCEIKGQRLGLGTNLFADVPTLGEKMGGEAFNWEMNKHSAYYTNRFFLGTRE